LRELKRVVKREEMFWALISNLYWEGEEEEKLFKLFQAWAMTELRELPFGDSPWRGLDRKLDFDIRIFDFSTTAVPRVRSPSLLASAPTNPSTALNPPWLESKMITKHITEVTTKFNPFKAPAKTCRHFLANLPANARSSMRINANVLPRDSAEPSTLKLKFSEYFLYIAWELVRERALVLGGADVGLSTEDGKEMQFDTEKLSITDVAEEVDRHSRKLNREAELR